MAHSWIRKVEASFSNLQIRGILSFWHSPPQLGHIIHQHEMFMNTNLILCTVTIDMNAERHFSAPNKLGPQGCLWHSMQLTQIIYGMRSLWTQTQWYVQKLRIDGHCIMDHFWILMPLAASYCFWLMGWPLPSCSWISFSISSAFSMRGSTTASTSAFIWSTWYSKGQKEKALQQLTSFIYTQKAFFLLSHKRHRFVCRLVYCKNKFYFQVLARKENAWVSWLKNN